MPRAPSPATPLTGKHPGALRLSAARAAGLFAGRRPGAKQGY
jgi:hypothetical protein